MQWDLCSLEALEAKKGIVKNLAPGFFPAFNSLAKCRSDVDFNSCPLDKRVRSSIKELASRLRLTGSMQASLWSFRALAEGELSGSVSMLFNYPHLLYGLFWDMTPPLPPPPHNPSRCLGPIHHIIPFINMYILNVLFFVLLFIVLTLTFNIALYSSLLTQWVDIYDIITEDFSPADYWL